MDFEDLHPKMDIPNASPINDVFSMLCFNLVDIILRNKFIAFD
jgi:hypothetical protein